MAKVPGTDVVADAPPDSESRPAEEFDFDFSYLGTGKPAPKEEEPPEEPPKKDGEDEPAPEDRKGKSDLEDEPEPPKKDEGKTQPPPELQAKLTTLESENTTLKGEIAKLTAQHEQFKSVQEALEELKKEPLVFVRKYLPSLAEKVDPRKYVEDKLKQEFGDQLAKFDSNESFQEGTLSYRIRVRREEIKDSLVQEERKLQEEQYRNTLEREARLNTSKQAVMKKYNLSDAQFEREVIEWSKTRQIGWEEIAKLRFFDEIVKAAVAKALKESKTRKGDKPEKGAEGIHGSADTGTPEHLRELNKEFGDIG